jgi:hypothetical protein
MDGDTLLTALNTFVPGHLTRYKCVFLICSRWCTGLIPSVNEGYGPVQMTIFPVVKSFHSIAKSLPHTQWVSTLPLPDARCCFSTELLANCREPLLKLTTQGGLSTDLIGGFRKTLFTAYSSQWCMQTLIQRRCANLA